MTALPGLSYPGPVLLSFTAFCPCAALAEKKAPQAPPANATPLLMRFFFGCFPKARAARAAGRFFLADRFLFHDLFSHFRGLRVCFAVRTYGRTCRYTGF
ncbi:MAG: hypothetical protein ACTTJV_05750 [Ottowia sp.]